MVRHTSARISARQRQRGIAEPVDLAPAEEEVHQARRRVIEPLEHLGRHDRGQRPGEQQEAEGEPAAELLGPQQERHAEAEDHLEGHRRDGEDERDARRAPEARIREEEAIVAEALEALDAEDRHALLEREPEHPEPGIHREAAERDQRRREIEQAQAPVGALAGRQRGAPAASARTSRRTNPTARRASATARAGAFTPTSAADSSGWSSVEIVT